MFGLSLAQWAAIVSIAGGLVALLKYCRRIETWLVNLWRRKRSKIDSDEGWLTPYDARMTFAESHLLNSLAAAEVERADAQAACELARSALGRINAQMSREEASGLSDAYQACDTRYGAALARWSSANNESHDNLLQRLQRGTLVAKGFVVPHEHGEEAKIIPAREWQFLQLLEDIEGAAGGGIEYFRVRIRQA